MEARKYIVDSTVNVLMARARELGKETDGGGESKAKNSKVSDQAFGRIYFNQGLKYANGIGLPRDVAKAKELFKKAGDLGNKEALKWLAENGDGTTQPKTATTSPVPSSSGKKEEAQRYFELALKYDTGDGVPKDFVKANELFQKAGASPSNRT